MFCTIIISMEDQRKEEAAVLMAEAILLTPTMQGLKVPWESSISWRLRRRREMMMMVGEDGKDSAREVTCDWMRILLNIWSWGETCVR